MESKELKAQAMQKEIEEINLIGLQLKYCKKHFDVWFPLTMKLANKMWRLRLIQSQPIFPNGGIAIVGENKGREMVQLPNRKSINTPTRNNLKLMVWKK